MKTLILITFLFLSAASHSQIKEIQLRECNKVGYITQGAYDIINEKCSDGNYKSSFRDFGYQRITVGSSFEFKDIDSSYETLFNSIINGFDTPKKDLAFELPDKILIISYETGLGIKGVVFNVKDRDTGLSSRSNAFLKGQIYKLFGFEKPKRNK